jgi:hypothetical protein
MAYGKQMEMVEKLANATEGGALKWKASVIPDQFQVSFRNNTVRIGADDGIGGNIQIQILNSNGDIVESFTDEDFRTDSENTEGSTYWSKLMSNLYKHAQRKALGADKVIDDIISDLDDIIPF